MDRQEDIEERRVAGELFHPQLHSNTPRLSEAYFNYYRSTISNVGAGGVMTGLYPPALRSHSQLLVYAKSLYDQQEKTRDQIMASWFPAGNVIPTEMYAASRAVVKVSLMIDCDAASHYPTRIGENPRLQWDRDQTIENFLITSFPIEHDPNINLDAASLKTLKAWKFMERHGIKIKATSNLVDHLQYDSEERTITLFHHVAYLRSHLQHSKTLLNLYSTFADSLRQYVNTQILDVQPTDNHRYA
ncbi:hypothetical protein F5Y04DRAFT_293263 [Hypomontagnella monticulosa]|nr:hypothetical protein F5Y04DRAFT_293263 [Hypomontagnella monticulosa]